MSFHKESHITQIVGGEGTGKSNLPLRGLLWQIVVEPTNPTCVWSLDLYNGKGEEIGGWDGDVGNLNSTYGLVIPLTGEHMTWRFFSVSRNEPISIRIVMKEEPYS